ncbi:hypothetical protein LXL04_010235 [Taraxacum kok-saghyz]
MTATVHMTAIVHMTAYNLSPKGREWLPKQVVDRHLPSATALPPPLPSPPATGAAEDSFATADASHRTDASRNDPDDEEDDPEFNDIFDLFHVNRSGHIEGVAVYAKSRWNLQSADVKKQTVFFLQTADVWFTSSAAEACRCGPQTADKWTNENSTEYGSSSSNSSVDWVPNGPLRSYGLHLAGCRLKLWVNQQSEVDAATVQSCYIDFKIKQNYDYMLFNNSMNSSLRSSSTGRRHIPVFSSSQRFLEERCRVRSVFKAVKFLVGNWVVEHIVISSGRDRTRIH